MLRKMEIRTGFYSTKAANLCSALLAEWIDHTCDQQSISHYLVILRRANGEVFFTENETLPNNLYEYTANMVRKALVQLLRQVVQAQEVGSWSARNQNACKIADKDFKVCDAHALWAALHGTFDPTIYDEKVINEFIGIERDPLSTQLEEYKESIRSKIIEEWDDKLSELDITNPHSKASKEIDDCICRLSAKLEKKWTKEFQKMKELRDCAIVQALAKIEVSDI